MAKNKTVSINSEAAAKLEDIACFDLAAWAENFQDVAGFGSERSDEITQLLWDLMPLIQQRQEVKDAAESGEVPKKIFKKHAEELTAMLADAAAPPVEVDPIAVRAEVLGDRAVAIISVPLSLDLASELVAVGRDGSKKLAWVAAQAGESILKEHALRNGLDYPTPPSSSSPTAALVPVAV